MCAELVDLQDRIRAQKVMEAIRKEIAKREENEYHLKRVAEQADEVREECRTLQGFMRNAWHMVEPGNPYLPNWHVDAIAEHLQGVHDKQIQRLVVNMPPGFMKSLTIGVMLPSWEWGPMNSAWLRYFTTSYEAGYARRDSRRHRDLVMSEWYQSLWPNVTLTKTAEDNFENTMKGGRKAVPFKRLTSGRGNRVIIDDPHSTEGAESELEREKSTRMFRESASSRLNNQETDAIIVVMQRLHPDDLCGVIDQFNLPYVKLILPMEYNRSLTVKTPWFTDPRTEEGELLHPKFMNREVVEAKKIEVMPHAYATQYQQQSRSREGAYYFGLAHILEEQPDKSLAPAADVTRCDRVFAIMDTASKIGAKRDGTGILYIAFQLHPKMRAWMIDYELEQIEAATLEVKLPTVIKKCEEYARKCNARMGSAGVFIEDKDSGVVLLQAATKKGLPAHAIPSELTSLGKEGRAVSVSGYVLKGLLKITTSCYNKLIVYKGRSKNHLVDQVTTFRMGRGTALDEDELFDCFNYAAAICFGNEKGL